MSHVEQTVAAGCDSDPAGRDEAGEPRYAVYPPLSRFHPGFGEHDYRQAARNSNADPIPRGLSLYVHIPAGCRQDSRAGPAPGGQRDYGKPGLYLEHLYREIEFVASLFDRDRPVVRLHFGAGTANYLDYGQTSELLESLARQFHLSRAAEREFGVALDAGLCTPDCVRLLAGHGFNRLSIRIRDVDHGDSRVADLHGGVERIRALLDAARDAGFRSTTLDLARLPGQSHGSLAGTLERVIALLPDRVVVGAFAQLQDGIGLEDRFDADVVPDAAVRRPMLEGTAQTLVAAGYRHIGMDLFARERDDLAHAQDEGKLWRDLQGYSALGACDLVGLGTGSISRIGCACSRNAGTVSGYYAALDAGCLPVERGLLMAEDDRIRADVIERLMCRGALDFAELEERHRIDVATYFATELASLRRLQVDHLIEITPRYLLVNSRGRYLLRIIAEHFDASRARLQARPGRCSPKL